MLVRYWSSDVCSSDLDQGRLRGSKAQVAQGGVISDHSDSTHSAREIFKTDSACHAPIAVARRRKQGEAEIGNSHQHQTEQHRPFHPHARIENAADEDADQIGPETQPDIVNSDFVIGVSKVIEQQAKGKVRQGVADLVKQDEKQHHKYPPTPEELDRRPGDGLHDFGHAAFLADLLMPFRLPHSEAPQHGRQCEYGAGEISRSEEHTSELQSLMRISYAVFCLKKKKRTIQTHTHVVSIPTLH